MSIGKRKEFMESRKPSAINKSIPIEKIRYVCQEKFLPVKLKKFYSDPSLLNIPIDVIFDSEGFYHVMDGHHRFLAAKKLNKNSIKANLYRATK